MNAETVVIDPEVMAEMAAHERTHKAGTPCVDETPPARVLGGPDRQHLRRFHRYEVGSNLRSTNGVEYHVGKDGALRRVDGKRRMSKRARRRAARG